MTMSSNQSNFRLPAEWEKHEATWLTWPQNTETWTLVELDEARKEYIHFLRTVLESERVNILVDTHEIKQDLLHRLQSKELEKRLTVHIRKTNDAWVRDYVPDFVRNGEKLSLINWEYNSWGGKYPPFDADNQVFELVKACTGYEVFHPEMILEAGSIDVNESGTLLTTESCLLNKNRNPELSKTDIEQKLRHYYGAKDIIWLKDGIVGDDTDGHVDDISRFINNNTILTTTIADPYHPDAKVLQENKEILSTTGFDVLDLPAPELVLYKKEPLPAGYANFYICNEFIVVPQYGVPQDHQALSIIQNLAGTRQVVGLKANYLLIGLGSFHCLSKQEPKLT